MPHEVVGPSSGRRLTKAEYINTVSDLLRVDLSGVDDASTLPDDQPATGGGFRNDINALLPAAVLTDAYETLATSVAQRVAWTNGLADHASCSEPTAACREGFVRDLGRLLYRRPLTDNDVQNLTPLFDAAGPAAADFEAGARLVLSAMLQSPHFLYRLERLDNIEPSSGKAHPSSFEIATRLSYFAWRSAPSASLLDAAAGTDFASPTSFAATVNTLFADPNAERGFQGYAEDWLQLYRLDARTPSLDQGVTPALIAEMKEETMRFATRIALTESRDLTALFTDKQTELGPALAGIYGVTPPAQGFAPFDLTSDPNRIGILTQPGFLILNAAPERATIVHRGLMVLRVFECSEVPAPPPNAATQIDMIPQNLTDRDRFALHTAAPTCKACHSAFDPLGYPFEPYDLAGRFSTKDAFGNTLRSDGEVILDGVARDFKNTAEFAGLMAQSASVQRCLLSKMFQYALGRSLNDADQAGIDDLTEQFASAGRTYLAGMGEIATSPALRAMAPTE